MADEGAHYADLYMWYVCIVDNVHQVSSLHSHQLCPHTWTDSNAQPDRSNNASDESAQAPSRESGESSADVDEYADMPELDDVVDDDGDVATRVASRFSTVSSSRGSH